MTAIRTVSEAGLAFIKAHEGFRRHAAPTPDGRWVVGHSHVGDDLAGDEMTPMVAEARLKTDLEPFEALIEVLVYAPLSQNQFDALVSFAFSIGADAFRASGVAALLNEGRPLEAADAFDAWRRARLGDRVTLVDALARRRAAEKALFLTVDDGPVAVPSALVRAVAGAGETVRKARPPRAAAARIAVGGTERDGPGLAAAARAAAARARALFPTDAHAWGRGWGLGAAGLVLTAAGVSQMRALEADGGLAGAWTATTLAGVAALAAAAFFAVRDPAASEALAETRGEPAD